MITSAAYGKVRKYRRWILAGSLALNLFLIGVIASPLFRNPLPPLLPGPERMIDRFARNMPEEDAVKLRAMRDENKASFDSERAEFRKAIRELREVLSEEKLDMEKLNQALDKADTAGNKIHREMADIIRKVAPSLSLEGRRHLFDMGPQGEGFRGPRGEPAYREMGVPFPPTEKDVGRP
jgi:uncharacterized membrane protein